jgi:hypothetical protein
MPKSESYHGCFSRFGTCVKFAGDASPASIFHSNEWSYVRNRKSEVKRDSKIRFCNHWESDPKQEVDKGSLGPS